MAHVDVFAIQTMLTPRLEVRLPVEADRERFVELFRQARIPHVRHPESFIELRPTHGRARRGEGTAPPNAGECPRTQWFRSDTFADTDAMELRRVRCEDARWIGDYHHRCWIRGYAGLVDQGVLELLRVEEHIARWDAALQDEPDVPVVVAVVEGLPVGHVRIEADTITNLYVDPDHWGRGIGRTLLSEGEKVLTTAGHDRGMLWTIIGNERAIALYESAGWAHDGTVEIHDSSAGVPVREQRMTKRLAGGVDADRARSAS